MDPHNDKALRQEGGQYWRNVVTLRATAFICAGPPDVLALLEHVPLRLSCVCEESRSTSSSAGRGQGSDFHHLHRGNQQEFMSWASDQYETQALYVRA